jgi:hypothetical protein
MELGVPPGGAKWLFVPRLLCLLGYVSRDLI